jgi:hypothetical protein
MTRRSLPFVFLVGLFSVSVASLAWQSSAGELLSSVEPSYLQLLHWRMVGPSRGGRVVAVCQHAQARDPAAARVNDFETLRHGV